MMKSSTITRGFALLLALSLGASLAHAQSARVRVRRGATTGMEMSLEGGLVAPRGGTLRWWITAYEVLGLSELRPAPGATIHAATSIARTEDAAEVTTDAYGRARVELAIPDDAPDSFTAVLRLVSRDGVQRRFELPIRVIAGVRLEVSAARPFVRPGGPLRAFGRLSDERSGRPRAGDVILTLRDSQGRPLDAPATVSADPAGLFAHTFEVPDDAAGRVTIEARTDDDEHPVLAGAMSSVGEPTAAPLLVSVGPARSLVAPAERVPLTVVVRTPEGRPVPGATVTLSGAERQDPDRRAVTDGRGRAQLAWTAPRYSSGIHDVSVQVTASREGWGTANGQAPLRVAADAYAASIAVEGGALAPSLGGRVWVRVVGSDGRPAGASVPVHASGPRLSAGSSATTDADGVATLDLSLAQTAGATADRCGGETATALDVRVGDGASATTRSLCLPLDPDAAARVRITHPLLTLGDSLELTVDRVAAAARLPVELTIFGDSGTGPAAIGGAVLAPDQRTTTLPLPADVTGAVYVRARPLLGDTRVVVRGGIAAAWVVPGAPGSVRAELDPDGTVRMAFAGRSDGAHSAYVVAAPIDEARELARVLEAQALGPLRELRTDPATAGEALLAAALAAHTPADVAAPAVLRNGTAVPLPAPSDPAAAGLLRDPWRSRARFVTGRLALIFRALESFVSESLPERIDDVAVRGPRGLELNGQILESVAASGRLGAEGATGLGGDPLTIEQLRAFDPAFTYDNVARRITRERLFRLILALRQFVQGHGFDLPWSRLGDPSEWMRQLEGQYVASVGQVDRQTLVDGWGRPFLLQRARGGRSRFRFVDPLGEWEVVSAGPDGRFGTGDDQWDPTARILRSGTPYAEAVGEDLLVARLEGVELGRATIQLLQGVEPQARAGRVPQQTSAPAQRLAEELWGGIPSVFEPPAEPLALRRPAHPGDGAGGTLHRVTARRGEARVPLDEEPRTWGAVVWAWTDDGWGAVAQASALGGSPIIVEAQAPSRLRAGEPVELELVVTNVRESTLPMRVATEGDGVEVGAPDELSLPAGHASTLRVRLAPDGAPRRAEARIRFVGPNDEALRSLRWPMRLVSGDHPLRLRAAGLVRARTWRTRFTLPDDARRGRGRVVVLAPNALAADPDLADLRREDPALVAFSNALAGRRSDPELWSALLRAQGPDGWVSGRDPVVSSACATVAWASADEHDADARAALERVRSALAGLGDPTGSNDPAAVRSASAALGALAAGGVPELVDASTRALDPVARLAAVLRTALRRTLRTHPEEPTLLARAAAALLLADPRDAYGLAMLDRAAEHLTPSPDEGALVVPSERMDDALESLGATLALAVAAHQADRAELSERLLRGALGREHVALRAGGEPAFWLLATGAYGALGAPAERVVVHVDGERHEIALAEGRGTVDLSARPGAHEVRVEPVGPGSAFVRVEAAVDRPFAARSDGPLTLSIEGDVGDTATGAALELAVHADDAVDAIVVDLQLPAGVDADDELRATLGASEGVRRVEARDPGFVRVWMDAMADGTTRTLPLPLRWRVQGTLRGLAVVAYPLARPEAMSALAPRSLQVGGPPEPR